MLIAARTYAEGRRVQITNITPRVLAFIRHFRETGGKAGQAAIASGYSRSSAAVTAARLLKSPRVLDLIAAEIRRHPGDYASTKAANRLLRPSRPEWLRTRFRLALDKHATLPRVIGSPEKPAVISNPADEAMREHLSHHFGADNRCSTVPANEIVESDQAVAGEAHRLQDAADRKSED
jgi:hypothetical protein